MSAAAKMYVPGPQVKPLDLDEGGLGVSSVGGALGKDMQAGGAGGGGGGKKGSKAVGGGKTGAGGVKGGATRGGGGGGGGTKAKANK